MEMWLERKGGAWWSCGDGHGVKLPARRGRWDDGDGCMKW